MPPIVTTVLELLGMLIIIAAASIWVGRYIPEAGLAVAGVGLIGVSAIATRLGRRR